MKYSVFIAFAAEDGLELARAVRDELAARGERAFVANEDAPVAEDWDDEIKRAQRQARVTLAVLTPAVTDSLHVKGEIQTGLDLRPGGHKVLPWSPPGGLKRAQWPSGLRALQGPSGEVAAAVRSVLGLLRPSTAPARFPDPASLEQAARWLDDRFPTPASRHFLLADHDLDARSSEPWHQLLADLDQDRLVALLEHADRGGGELGDLVDRIRRGASPAPGDRSLPARLQRQLDEAIQALNDERFAAALAAFRTLEAVARGEEGQEELVNRALLNQVAALNALDRHEEIDAVLDRVDPVFLAPSARGNFGRFLVGARRWEDALEAAPDSQVVQQLVALRRDRQLIEPQDLADDADVLLSAAIVHTDAGNAATAIALAERVLAAEQLLDQGRRSAAEVIGKALYRWWIGLSAQPVPEPGPALTLLRELVADRAAAWPEVEQSRRLVELEPTPDLEPQPLDEHAPLWMREIKEGFGIEVVAARHSSVGAAQLELARWHLHQQQPSQAVEAARRAFDALPGRGQLLVLCQALLTAGEKDEAAALAESIEPTDSPSWYLHVALADSESERLERARSWVAARPDDARGWVVLAWTAGRLAHVDEARRAALRVLELEEEPSFDVCQRLACVATTGGAGVDRGLVRRLERRLREPGREDPRFEGLRAQLLLALGDGNAPPPDWQALSDAELVHPFTLDDMHRLIRHWHERALFMDRAWDSGLICFETWSEQRGMESGHAALGLKRRELYVPPPYPPEDPAEWQGRRCLVGGLALEALVALDLLDAFAEAVGKVVVFSDVWERIYSSANLGHAEAWRKELERVATLWAPVEDLPPGGEENLRDEDVPSVRAWLGQLGVLPRTEDEPWSPPPGPVVLGGGALLALGSDLEKFLAACRQQEIDLAISKRAREGRRNRAYELRLRLEMLELSTRLFEWLGYLTEQDKIEVLDVLPPPPLPPLRSGQTIDPDEDPTARAWAARESLRVDPNLVLVAAELVEWGVDGAAPFKLIIDRAWSRQTYDEHKHRYDGCRGRVTTLGTVVRDLSCTDTWPDRAEKLAAAGYVDALSGPDVVELHDRFGNLVGETPRRVLLGLVSWARGPERLPHHSFFAMKVGFGLVSEAVEHLWFAERRVDPGPVIRSILEAVEDLDRVARWRHGLLVQAITGLALRSLQRPDAFLESEGEDEIQVGLDSAGGRLWAKLGAWASDDGRRTAALYRGVAAALLAEGLDPTSRVTRAFATFIVLCLPGRTGVLDMSSDPWAALLTRIAGPEELGEIQVVGDNHRLREWLEGALAVERPTLDPPNLRIVASLRLDAPPARQRVWIPVELGFETWGPELGRAVAAQVAGFDGAVAQAAEQWAAEPTDARHSALTDAIASSPLRAVRTDPRAVLEWSTWRGIVTSGVRSLEQLEALLGELPEDRGKPAHDRLTARIDREHGRRNLVPLLAQLGRMPGAAVGAGARRWLGDPELREHFLRRALRLLEHHRDVPAGEVGDAIVALAVLAGEEPVVQLDDQDLHLPQLVADLATAALAPHESQDDVAAREPALVRLCGSIVAGLASRLEPQDWIWLSWRLHGWLLEHVLAHPQQDAVLADLCQAAPDIVDPERATDLLDPRRFGSGRVDLRELIVIQALSLAWSLQRGEDGETTPVRVDWGRLMPLLHRIATRPLTPDENLLREPWIRSSMGGQALCAPDAARLLLLVVDTAQIWTVERSTRMLWLDDALHAARGGEHLHTVREMVLAAVASSPKRWSPAETEVIVERVSDDDFAVHSSARRTLVVAAFGAGADHLSDRALAAVSEELESPLGPPLAGEWLLGHARLGDLSGAVQRLRDRAAEREADPVDLLQGLSRVVLSPHRPQAVAVLEELVQEEALAEGLEPLRRYATGEEAEE